MAFERPLEADRVDDLGFLSSFVRAPIVGPLMWFLGGDLARSLDEEEKEQDELSTICAGVGDGDDPSLRRTIVTDSQALEDAGEVVSSDVSDSGDSSSSASVEDVEQLEEPSDSRLSSIGLARTAKCLNLTDGRKLCKGRKKLSFSDEVPGKSLAEYFYVDETNSTLRSSSERAGSPTRGQPIKSVMKKSGSFRSSSSSSDTRTASGMSSSRYIPSGITGGKGGGVVMPAGGWMGIPPTIHSQGSPSVGGGGGSPSVSGGGSGYVSPQWGWYISTTPPTPEQYHAPRKSKSGKKHMKSSDDRQPPPTVAEDYPMPVFKNSPTPVFMKNGAKDVFGNDTMGWPSVPL